MIREIQNRVPEYARPLDETYVRTLRQAVAEALRQFVDRIGDPYGPWENTTEIYRTIGRGEAAEGRSLDPLQTALRLGARVGWRRLASEADRLGLNPQALYALGEAIFVLMDEMADAAAEGYAEAQAHAAGESERRRRRLLDLVLIDPPASPDAIADLARAAQWRLPKSVAGVALVEREDEFRAPSLPPDVLFDLHRPEPCMVVPDPEGPGRRQMLEVALRDWDAVIGPTVPLADVAKSLRWAREALALARRGVIPHRGSHLVRCADHMSTLVVFKDEDLVDALAADRLAPLSHLRPGQQDRLAETLLAWLQNGHNANEVANRLHVHPQTVRYRLRQLEELYGDQLTDPDLRFELEIVLRARHLRAQAPAQPTSS
ncbi:PucR family transcriptional regulator [Bailinhaonella thermotolerans]|uniref:PucR family transcriptional regulator n=2 Tax=Bailinhaonella thermotolerans TaxID=1070861 RepID=A0A3A4APR1_9ACTN|nr:PucR family transcriptional regulator [Bailinhaonella thermotolerans]